MTAGETIIFQIDNTAGFEHDFWIGTDSELSAPNSTTDVGIPAWSSGVQTLEWVVPADVSGLKFGCTIPGHYYTMQGTFSMDGASAQPAPPSGPAAVELAAPAVDTASAPAAPPAQPAAAAGDARVIDLVADVYLQFKDLDGQPVTDIPVTPGETVRFQMENTAGFPLNFWIGSDLELSVPNATTDVGIPDFASGVQAVDWVVPADLSAIKFASTVPCLYYTMQGTFSTNGAAAVTSASIASGDAAAAATAVDSAVSSEAAPSSDPVSAAGSDARVIDLEADAAIRFMQDGEQIRELQVTPGETIIFRIDNTAGFAHNFFIGPDAALQVPNGSTDTGLPDWNSGVQELAWVVPDDVTDLRFACTVPGHYYTMQGDFTVSV